MKRLAMVLYVGTLWGCEDQSAREGALEQALQHTRPRGWGLGEARLEARPLQELRAHLIKSESEFDLRQGERLERLKISREIAREGARFRLLEVRSLQRPSRGNPEEVVIADSRFEAIYDGQRLATREGLGPFVERDPMEGLPLKILRIQHDLCESVLRAWGDYFAVTREGEGPRLVETVTTSRWALKLDPEVVPRPMEPEEAKALHDHDQGVYAWLAAHVQPEQVTGALTTLGSELRADRIAEAELKVSGRVHAISGATFAFSLKQGVTPLNELKKESALRDFTIPDGTLPISRERPWKMVKDVLGESLLAPYVGKSKSP